MLPLYLLATHMVGDYLLQTRWQAAAKLFLWRYRARHVLSYTACFVPVAAVYADTWHAALTFLVALLVLHFATDSRRLLSTPGDWIAWNVGGAAPSAEKRGVWAAMGAPLDQFELKPNPWPPMPILIDQSLHVCQLALLAGIFLS